MFLLHSSDLHLTFSRPGQGSQSLKCDTLVRAGHQILFLLWDKCVHLTGHHLSPLILLVPEPGLQLPHHHLSLPLCYGTAFVIMSRNQIVDIREVGFFSGQDHHLALHRFKGTLWNKGTHFGKSKMEMIHLTGCPVNTPDRPDCLNDWIDFISPKSLLSARRFASGDVVFFMEVSLSVAFGWLNPLRTATEDINISHSQCFFVISSKQLMIDWFIDQSKFGFPHQMLQCEPVLSCLQLLVLAGRPQLSSKGIGPEQTPHLLAANSNKRKKTVCNLCRYNAKTSSIYL